MYTYLALGDSYTIGEAVPMKENFPHQAVAILKEDYKIDVAQPVIIAKTGWTTDELAYAIREHNLHEHFTFVSLLIGVNNQYRGLSFEDYKTQFTQLLDQAIVFANGHTQNVFVLSIPDWGVTPFAADRDKEKIAADINAYNAVNKSITEAYRCNYVTITESTRKNGSNPDFLAEDGLHPSGREYLVWAKSLAEGISNVIG